MALCSGYTRNNAGPGKGYSTTTRVGQGETEHNGGDPWKTRPCTRNPLTPKLIKIKIIRTSLQVLVTIVSG